MGGGEAPPRPPLAALLTQNEEKLPASDFDISIAKSLFCSSVHSAYRN